MLVVAVTVVMMNVMMPHLANLLSLLRWLLLCALLRQSTDNPYASLHLLMLLHHVLCV